jgi:hypothetical protein
MDLEQFDAFVLVPTLKVVGLFSQPARVLMLGTALIESNLNYLRQLGGEGLGIYSIEPATHKDIQRYLNRPDRTKLKDRCLAACLYTGFASDDALIHNLRYAVIMARVKYFIQKENLPVVDDAPALAQYHKKYYNTAKGLTDVTESIKIFERVIDAVKE